MARSILKQIEKTNCYCMYAEELEYLLAIDEILAPIERNKVIGEVYTDEFVAKLRKKFPMLVELAKGFSAPLGMMFVEGLTTYDKKEFSIHAFMEYTKQKGAADFLGRCVDLPEEEARNYLKDKENRVKFFTDYNFFFKNYTAVEYVTSCFDDFVDEVYAVVKECMTNDARTYIETHFNEVASWLCENEERLKAVDALEYSQQIMGKRFARRGPYEKFYFMPSFFIACKTCRWMMVNQVLIYDVKLNSMVDEAQISETLKMLSDGTRFKILKALKQKGHMKGVEISQYMELSTSTVSHHMSQLRNAGLIHEETEGTTKIYSINQRQVEECVKFINNTLL